MPIENIEDALAPIEKGNETKRRVLAGLIVRHELIPYRFIIEGFVVEDRYFNPNDFRVNQMNIEYQYEVAKYNSINAKVYPKMIIDGKSCKLTEYIPNTNFEERDITINFKSFEFNSSSSQYGKFANGFVFIEKVYSDRLAAMRFNYYLFDTTVSEIPICVANKVFVLCKYWEDGKFKYMIFNLHEIKPDV